MEDKTLGIILAVVVVGLLVVFSAFMISRGRQSAENMSDQADQAITDAFNSINN